MQWVARLDGAGACACVPRPRIICRRHTLTGEAFTDRHGDLKAAETFETASRSLLAAAAGGDPKVIVAKFGAAAKACRGCHSPYRK
jgi:cytochrome c556